MPSPQPIFFQRTVQGTTPPPLLKAQMCRLVEAHHPDVLGRTRDLADCTSVLHELPVRRQRLIQYLQQNCTIDALVTHHDDSFGGMPFNRNAQCIGGACYEILKRFAIWKSHPLGVRTPAAIEL